MAISRAREAVRASSRFATFTHATSSTMPTAPSSTSSAARAGPLTTSFMALTRTTRWALAGPSMAFSSCRAPSSTAPFFNRPSTASKRRLGWLRSSAGARHGIHRPLEEDLSRPAEEDLYGN